MSKGKLSYEKWSVLQQGDQDFVAERIINGNHETIYIHAHCLACAKVDLLGRYGGTVDLRGTHLQGICGSFLQAIQSVVDQEDESDETTDQF